MKERDRREKKSSIRCYLPSVFPPISFLSRCNIWKQRRNSGPGRKKTCFSTGRFVSYQKREKQKMCFHVQNLNSGNVVHTGSGRRRRPRPIIHPTESMRPCRKQKAKKKMKKPVRKNHQPTGDLTAVIEFQPLDFLPNPDCLPPKRPPHRPLLQMLTVESTESVLVFRLRRLANRRWVHRRVSCTLTASALATASCTIPLPRSSQRMIPPTIRKSLPGYPLTKDRLMILGLASWSWKEIHVVIERIVSLLNFYTLNGLMLTFYTCSIR